MAEATCSVAVTVSGGASGVAAGTEELSISSELFISFGMDENFNK
jgi:hypothetical protein